MNELVIGGGVVRPVGRGEFLHLSLGQPVAAHVAPSERRRPGWDHEFESPLLQRRVLCEPDRRAPRWRGSLQDNKLLAEKCHLGFASRMRSEHSDEQSDEQLQEVDHPEARIGSAWLSDTEGPTAQTTAALYRAKYMVGEVVSRITRTALTLGGAHGIFKTSRLEQLFRDGALGPGCPEHDR